MRNAEQPQSKFERLSEDVDETVYPPCPRPPLFRSKYYKKVRVDAWCQKTGCYSTFGPPKVYCDPPACFLKKYTYTRPEFLNTYSDMNCSCDGDTESIDDEDCHCQCQYNCNCCQCPMTSPPYRTNSLERRMRLGVYPPPPRVCRGRRDFIRENVIRAIRMPARRTSKCWMAEDEDGQCQHFVDMSEVPLQFRPGFGQVPEYIQERKCQQMREARCLKENVAENQFPPCSRVMDPCERYHLISELEGRRRDLNREYRNLPAYINDCVDNKKDNLEAEMRLVQGDLRLLKSDGPLLISTNPQLQKTYHHPYQCYQ